MKNKKSMKKILILIMALILAGCSNETSAKTYYKEGMSAMGEGNYEKAEENFGNAIEKNNEKSEYYVAYGMALIKTGKYEEAQEQFDKAILDKNNKIVRENNKQAYRGKGIAYLEAEKYEDAIENFEMALEITDMDDLNVDIEFYLAEAYESNEDYENAVLVYNNIEKKQKSGILYINRAKANAKLGQYDAASNDFDQAIHMDKNQLSYYLEKYFMLLEAGKTQEAEGWIDTASSIEAKNTENKVYAAMIQYYHGETEKAIDELVELKDNHILAGYFLGNIYKANAEFEKAAECYETYINNKEKQTNFMEDVYENLAYCYVQLSEHDKSISLLEEAIALENGKTQKNLMKTLVAVYEQNVQFDKALQVAKSYLEIYPNNKEMKKEYRFLRSRVVKADNTADSVQATGTESGTNEQAAETIMPEETETANQTIQPEQTTEPDVTGEGSESGNAGKPDIVE